MVQDGLNEKDKRIYITPSFHYDVAYLKPYREYLEISFRNINEALRILEKHPQYCFLIEQVILLEEYWNHFPENRDKLAVYAKEGRLSVAPGMYVMPDMNHPDGESMYMQAKIGKQWLMDHLGIEPTVCWIADCWGHHAQLPQIIRQAGYEYYVFWRCMRRDVMKNDFIWKGMDGTLIKSHWLAKSYANIVFPASEENVNALDMNFVEAGTKYISALYSEMQKYGPSNSILLCNGGDFMFPQESGVKMLERLNQLEMLPFMEFSTPSGFLESIDWEKMPVFGGEFNSALQGTFTSNIHIKQLNRRLTNRIKALESLSVLSQETPIAYTEIWKLILKQQFHDIICGTLTDEALKDCYKEFDEAEKLMDTAYDNLVDKGGIDAFYNPLSFERTELVEYGGKKLLLSFQPLSFTNVSEGREIQKKVSEALPCSYENDYYKAEINKEGYITSLKLHGIEDEIVCLQPAPFGSLGMQIDNGDLWLNFDSPLSGGSMESSLTQNHPDPYDRSEEGSIVNSATFSGKINGAEIVFNSYEEMIVEQQGLLNFWTISVPFKTRIQFRKDAAIVRYETRIEPTGKHYRIRVAFPTAWHNGKIRHEIPFGIQERGEHEHIAQNWMDYQDMRKGLTLYNSGNPGNNVNDGVMMLTLFRSAAMEYKAPSESSFNEGIPQVFQYGIMPHGINQDIDIVKTGYSFANSPVFFTLDPTKIGKSVWRLDKGNVFISALRWSDSHIFLRIYEAIGLPTSGRVFIPENIIQYCETDGIERPINDYRDCSKFISFDLKAFEVKGFLLKRKEE